MNDIGSVRAFNAVCILILSAIMLIGGCDIDFSSDRENGGSLAAVIQGFITDTTPERDLDGIRVQITDENSGISFSDTTDVNGFFEIEGGFSGISLVLEFVDGNQEQIAITSITVFPDAEVDLGNLSLTNGIVVFQDEITITYVGDITENNCDINVGTIIVTRNETDVIVQINSSTIIRRDDDDLNCQDLLISQEVEVRGTLLTGNSIDAFELNI
ncbi:MAG: hypothetical protein V3U74_06975 [Thermodesulfobacteriota bacterium]